MSTVQFCEALPLQPTHNSEQQLNIIRDAIETTSRGRYFAGAMHCKLLYLLQAEQSSSLQCLVEQADANIYMQFRSRYATTFSFEYVLELVWSHLILACMVG